MSKIPSKKEIKQSVHDNGFFLQIPLDVQANALREKYPELAAAIPDDAFPWGGIASQEVINRNGYGIRVDAWKPAIAGYMMNPIIFFQHDTNKALGKTLSIEVTENGLEVFGYVRRKPDQAYAEGNIEANIYTMLSTGHYTLDFEMENLETGEIITSDAWAEMVKKQGWGSWMENWFLWVTKLEMIEWSIVGVGSVPGALKSNTGEDIWCNHLGIKKEDIMATVNSADEEIKTPENEGETPEATDEEGAKSETESTVPAETVPVDEKATEVPPTDPPIEEKVVTESVQNNAAQAPVEPNAVVTPAMVTAEEVNALRSELEVSKNKLETMSAIAIAAGTKAVELESLVNSIIERLNTSLQKKALVSEQQQNFPVMSGRGDTIIDLINKSKKR
jgi:hypothetical protein